MARRAHPDFRVLCSPVVEQERYTLKVFVRHVLHHPPIREDQSLLHRCYLLMVRECDRAVMRLDLVLKVETRLDLSPA